MASSVMFKLPLKLKTENTPDTSQKSAKYRIFAESAGSYSTQISSGIAVRIFESMVFSKIITYAMWDDAKG